MAPERRPDMTAGFGIELWSSPAWRAGAVEWLDSRLADAGIERTGEVEQPRVRAWATVLRAPTSGGDVWLKAAAPRTAFEVPLYDVLARVVPDQVLRPIASDTARGWILLPDGGPVLGEVSELAPALVEYARLQRAVEPYVGELLATGVSDMRPAVMPERFDEALTAAVGVASSDGDRALVERIARARPEVVRWCAELAESPLPASLDHNDLHPWNVLGSAPPFRFYDWGDSVVAHPFAATLVPLGMIEGEADVAAARDAYLAEFADLDVPPSDLVRTLDLARRVANVARALTWERALAASREQGEEVEERFAKAPLEAMALIVDPARPAV